MVDRRGADATVGAATGSVGAAIGSGVGLEKTTPRPFEERAKPRRLEGGPLHTP